MRFHTLWRAHAQPYLTFQCSSFGFNFEARPYAQRKRKMNMNGMMMKCETSDCTQDNCLIPNDISTALLLCLRMEVFSRKCVTPENCRRRQPLDASAHAIYSFRCVSPHLSTAQSFIKLADRRHSAISSCWHIFSLEFFMCRFSRTGIDRAEWRVWHWPYYV